MAESRCASDAPARVEAWISARLRAPADVVELAARPRPESSTVLHLLLWRLTDEVAERATHELVEGTRKVDLAIFHTARTSDPLDRLLDRLAGLGLRPRRVVAARREAGVEGRLLLIHARRKRGTDLEAIGTLVRLAELTQLLREPGRPSPRVASDMAGVLAGLHDVAQGFEVRPDWAHDEGVLRRVSPQVVVTADAEAPAVRAAVQAGARVVDPPLTTDDVGEALEALPDGIVRPVVPATWLLGRARDADGFARLVAVADRLDATVSHLRVTWSGSGDGPDPSTRPSLASVEVVVPGTEAPWPRPHPTLVLRAPDDLAQPAWGQFDPSRLLSVLRETRVEAVLTAADDGGWWAVRASALDDADRRDLEAGVFPHQRWDERGSTASYLDGTDPWAS